MSERKEMSSPLSKSNAYSRWLGCAAISAALLAVLSVVAHAQTVTATIAAGKSPASVAVNPATRKIDTVNEDSNSVTVIGNVTVTDGATNNTTPSP